LAAVLLAGVGCSSPPSDPAAELTIPRETFLEAYVQLRAAAMRSSRWQIGTAERDRILAGLGITEQDLIIFVEVRGDDLEYMTGLWSDVDSIMLNWRTRPGGRSGPGGAG
jgi:hypothetical protein